jgi:hypothetical protein
MAIVVGCLAMGGAAAPAAGPAATAKAAAKLDLSYIPEDAAFAAILHPRQVLTSRDAKWLPVEVLSAISLRDYGFDPIDVEQAVVLGFPPDASPLRYGAIVRFAKAVDREKLLPALFKTAERDKIAGHDVWRVDAPLPSLCMVGDRTFLLAPMSELKSMLDAKDTDGELQKQLKKADVSHHLTTVFSYDAVREQLKTRLEAAPELPPPLADLAKLIDHVSAQELRVDLGLELRTEVVLYARGADSVPEIERLVKSATKSGKEQVLAMINRDFKLDDADPVQAATAAYSRRLVTQIFDSIKTVRHDGEQTVSVTGIGEMSVTGVAVALLLPAVQATREAARRAQSSNNLKQLALAFFTEETRKGRFPAQASYDKDGKKLLSWRVHILPHLDQTTLYEKFRLDEPWDSEHNKKLIPLLPSVYRNPNRPNNDYKTTYLAVTGKSTLFDGKDGATIASIRDGTANTLLLVEADEDRAVVWTKPDDLEVSEKDAQAGLGNFRPGGFLAAFADGHVQMVPGSLSPKQLWAIFTRAGGEIVDLP